MRSSTALAFGSLTVALTCAVSGCLFRSQPGPDDSGPEPGPEPGSEGPWGPTCPAPITCGETVTIAPTGNGLIVRDAQALAPFALQDVLARVLQIHKNDPTPPAELARRLFDVNNTSADNAFADGLHCDSSDNPAHALVPAAFCPRDEGKLARVENLFDPQSDDSFYPVAVVNRFDKMSIFGDSCGEYRIVYAKKSGLTNPDNRVFVIVETAIPNPEPGCLEVCRPLASFWQHLGDQTDPKEVASRLKTFFFDGIAGFAPALSPQHLGLSPQGTPGQIRVSEHVGGVWQLREMRLSEDGPNGTLRVTPVTVKNNPAPSMFESGPFQKEFLSAVGAFADPTSGSYLPTTGMFDGWESGESALGGPTINDYSAHTPPEFLTRIQDTLDSGGMGFECPSDDPLDANAIVRRATAQSCAGCHAPKQLLGESRSLGCGLVQPDTLGEVHINEHGEISPALKDAFLPHRALLMQGYLAACDMGSMMESLLVEDPVQSPPGGKRPMIQRHSVH